MAGYLTPILLSSVSARELGRLIAAQPRGTLEQLLQLEEQRPRIRKGVVPALRAEIARRKAGRT
jgi:hypothetical protein